MVQRSVCRTFENNRICSIHILYLRERKWGGGTFWEGVDMLVKGFVRMFILCQSQRECKGWQGFHTSENVAKVNWMCACLCKYRWDVISRIHVCGCM